tara:strand:- start:231 stop:416 length:186 start_codon:yes stop_codon:yes gene_type:complete
MQLRLQPRTNKNLAFRSFAVKMVLIFIVFFLAVFLLDRIDFKVPKKLIKQEITNDKLITLK